MNGKDIFKQLLPGVIVGLFLGFGLVNLIGVDTENAIPNYIGGAMCCLVPTFLNCFIVLKGTAKHLNRKLPIGQTLLRILPWMILGGIIGLIVVYGGVEKLLNIDTRTISVFMTAIYEAILGVIVSTILAYFALKKYVKDVKYTKRK